MITTLESLFFERILGTETLSQRYRTCSQPEEPDAGVKSLSETIRFS